MEIIVGMATPIITGVAVSLIVFFVTKYYSSVQAQKSVEMERKETERLETAKRNSEKIDDLTNLTMALAKHKILVIGSSCIKKGSITSGEKGILESIYEIYEKRGGNGTGKVIMQEVDKLPLDD